MTVYLSFVDEKSATAASQADWLTVLGRPKRPEDVTEFLYGVLVNPNTGAALGVVTDNIAALVPISKQMLSNADPIVADTLLAISAEK